MKWIASLLLRFNLIFASLRHRDQKDVEYYLEEFNGDLAAVPKDKSKGRPKTYTLSVNEGKSDRVTYKLGD